jgi:hypothetical protein
MSTLHGRGVFMVILAAAQAFKLNGRFYPVVDRNRGDCATGTVVNGEKKLRQR